MICTLSAYCFAIFRKTNHIRRTKKSEINKNLLVRQILSPEQNLTALWLDEAGNQIEQGCFPRTVATHQGINPLFLQ